MGIHEGTSMIITARDGSSEEAGYVKRVHYFEHGPNRGRSYKIDIQPLDESRPVIHMIRNRSQLGGGWINKTHTAKISNVSW